MNTATQTNQTKTMKQTSPGTFLNEFFSRAMGENQNSGRFWPAVNVIEFDDRYELHMALPGFAKGDVHVTVDNDIVTIASEKEFVNDKNYRLREFVYGKFERKFQLPETVNPDKIEAKFDNGVLVLTLPKKDEVIPKPPKQIKIS